MFLITAGLLEVAWSYFLTKSQGLQLWRPAGLFLLTLLLSMAFLASAVKTIPIGIAYPVWTGIGAVGAVLLGVFCFAETMTLGRCFFTVLIVAGVVGLKVSSP